MKFFVSIKNSFFTADLKGKISSVTTKMTNLEISKKRGEGGAFVVFKVFTVQTTYPVVFPVF